MASIVSCSFSKVVYEQEIFITDDEQTSVVLVSRLSVDFYDDSRYQDDRRFLCRSDFYGDFGFRTSLVVRLTAQVRRQGNTEKNEVSDVVGRGRKITRRTEEEDEEV